MIIQDFLVTKKGDRLWVVLLNPDSFECQILLETDEGEHHSDLSKILPHKPLLNAVWVEKDKEDMADAITFLERTEAVTQNGFNNYRMFNIIN